MHRYNGLDRRILADKILVAPELVVAIILHLPLERAGNGEQLRVGCSAVHGRVLLNRLEVIEDPERAAVRCHEHGVIPGMQRDLVHPHIGEVGLQSAPALATIERKENAGLRAEVQHVRIPLILGERSRHLTSQVRVERPKRRAEIAAYPDVRLIVIESMVVDGDVDRACVESRRYHLRNERVTRGESRQMRRDILPAATAVA